MNTLFSPLNHNLHSTENPATITAIEMTSPTKKAKPKQIPTTAAASR